MNTFTILLTALMVQAVFVYLPDLGQELGGRESLRMVNQAKPQVGWFPLQLSA